MKNKTPLNLFWITSWLLVLNVQIQAQSVIASWDFNNTNTAISSGSGLLQTIGNLNSSFPTSTSGKCLQLTNFSNQSAFNASRGMSLEVNTLGYGGIVLHFSHRASGPASRWARLDYTLDGQNWVLGFWDNAGGLFPQNTWQTYNVDFSSVVGAENNPNFQVRIVSIFSPLAFDESNLDNPFAANTAYMMADEAAVYLPNSSNANNGGYTAMGMWRFDDISFTGLLLPVWTNLTLSQSMNSTYGSPSNAATFVIAAGSWSAPIQVSPQPGFEISTSSGSGFTQDPLNNLTNGTAIYVRTIYNKPAGTFNSSPCLQLTSIGTLSGSVNCTPANNEVAPKALSITANDVSKELGQLLVGGSGQLGFTTLGLISGEAIQSLTIAYGPAGLEIGAGATVGIYAGQVIPSLAQGNYLASNYLISYLPGSISVTGFTPGNLLLNRIGDGNSALGTIAYPLSLLEFIPNGNIAQSLVQQFENTNLLTETGELNVSTGYINSVDQLVGIPGFAAMPGTNDLAQTQAKATNILGTGATVTTRVVFPTSGQILPFLEGYLTSLIPLPNNCFYAAGNGLGNSGGVWYFDGVNFTQLTAAFGAIRTLEIFNQQLYFSTAESPAGIYELGVGLPTSAGQAVTLVIATPAPRGFSFSPDGQTAYVADDQPIDGSNGGGIQKWQHQNTVWTKIYTHAHRANGILVDYADSLPKLYASTFLSSPGQDNNKLIVLTDSSQNALAIELASSGNNYIYKGIDFSPAAPPQVPQIALIEQPSCSNGFGKVHLSGLPTGKWRITGFPGGSKTGVGPTAVLEDLAPGHNYTFKVTSYTGRSSALSAVAAIQAAPLVPDSPTGQQQQKRCNGASIEDLALNESNIVWYAAINSTQALPTTQLLVHQSHYFAAQLANSGCQSAGRLEVEALVLPNGAWKGQTQGSWKQATNWCGGVPALGASVFVPNLTTIQLDTFATLSQLEIASDAHLKIKSNQHLTIQGNVALHGQLTIENKGTIVQEINSNWTGNGQINVQQFITGTGLTNPTGRFWFLGAPMSNTLSGAFEAQTSAVLKFFNEPLGTWVEITDALTPLVVGRGYFIQSAIDDTLVFNGTALNNGNFLLPCTRTTTSNYYRGFNLVSNPYASYLDFNATNRTNLLPTMWYRTADPLQNMVFDTYNAQNGLGTSLSGEAVTQYIPPFQSFWVKIPDGNITGSLGLSNAMRSHYTTGFEGLKSSTVQFPAFIRLDLVDGLKKDQLLICMDNQVSNQVDDFDSEKMLVANYPQCYTAVNGKKLVINALKLSKTKNQIPLILELPVSKSYILHADSLFSESGLILLEDKQLGVFQNLALDPDYTFFATSGTNSTRFVLHFNVPIGSSNSALSPIEALQHQDLAACIKVFGVSPNEILVTLVAEESPEGSIQLYDPMGRLIEQKAFTQQIETLKAPAQRGVYSVKVQFQNRIYTYQVPLIQ